MWKYLLPAILVQIRIFPNEDLEQPSNEVDFGGEEITLFPPLPLRLTDT